MLECTLPSALPLTSSPPSFTSLLQKLELSLPFAYTRFGDVEWLALTSTQSQRLKSFNRSHGNDRVPTYDHCVHEAYEALLVEREQASVAADQLVIGAGEFFLCREAHPQLFFDVQRYLRKRPRLRRPFNRSFYFPLTSPAVNTLLLRRHVVLVGPAHLNALRCMLSHVAFIRVPQYGAFSTNATRCSPGGHGSEVLEALAVAIERYSRRYPDLNIVFLLTGGLIAKLLMQRLLQRLGHKDTLIDFGARTLRAVASVSPLCARSARRRPCALTSCAHATP